MLVEKRTFIGKDKYEELMNMLKNEGTEFKKTNQVIYKYKSDVDFRLVFDKNDSFLRIRGISGTDKDQVVHIKTEEVKTLTVMLHHLGMNEEIRWYRIRTKGIFRNYTVTLDETYQYGYVASIAKEVPEEQQVETSQELEQLFHELNIALTSKEEFNDRYKYYKVKWIDFAENIDEQAFIARN